MPLLAAFVALVVGVAVYAANPARVTNRVYFGYALLIFATMVCVHQAVDAVNRFRAGEIADPVPWIRGQAIVAAFGPFGLWLLKESLKTRGANLRIGIRCLPWVLTGLVISLIALSDSYIPPDSTPLHHKRGIGYAVTASAMTSAYIVIVLQTRVQLQGAHGIRRLELQFLVLSLAIAAISLNILSVIGNVLSSRELKSWGLMIVVGVYALSGWALIVHRIFDPRHILLWLIQRAGLVAFLVLGTGGLSLLLGMFTNATTATFLAFAFCWGPAIWLDRKSRTRLGITHENRLANTRAAIIGIARQGHGLDKLVHDFQLLLVSRLECSPALLLLRAADDYASAQLTIARSSPLWSALGEQGWATPENLERRRSSPHLDAAREFLENRSLGLIVTAPAGSPAPSLVIALGVKTNQSPFTYPEIEQLQNIAELMDNILTHSRLTAQAALQARIEHLAMMSRGLAHDLKNLVTPISSFLVHAEQRLAPGTVEHEVHAAAQRSVRVMDDYVREALFFANRLEPKFEAVNTGPLFSAVREVTASRAAGRRVAVKIAPDSDHALVGDGVLLQRMLGNLVSNAIDASGSGTAVTLAATSLGPRGVRLQVIDEGCGITTEHLGRIFDPYFTTKEFGDDVRGFGLGLTISQKIAHLHQGTIAVLSQLGLGTTMTVELPPLAPMPRLPERPAAESILAIAEPSRPT